MAAIFGVRAAFVRHNWGLKCRTSLLCCRFLRCCKSWPLATWRRSPKRSAVPLSHTRTRTRHSLSFLGRLLLRAHRPPLPLLRLCARRAVGRVGCAALPLHHRPKGVSSRRLEPLSCALARGSSSCVAAQHDTTAAPAQSHAVASSPPPRRPFFQRGAAGQRHAGELHCARCLQGGVVVTRFVCRLRGARMLALRRRPTSCLTSSSDCRGGDVSCNNCSLFAVKRF